MTVRIEGKRQVKRLVEFYSLEAIIAVGYRVKSQRGTQFRQWATERLREFIVKGFVIDDERLAEYGADNMERCRPWSGFDKDWIGKLDAFLKLNDQGILTHAGKISADEALDIAESEYEKFSENRRQVDADHADEELKETIRKLTEGKQDSL